MDRIYWYNRRQWIAYWRTGNNHRQWIAYWRTEGTSDDPSRRVGWVSLLNSNRQCRYEIKQIIGHFYGRRYIIWKRQSCEVLRSWRGVCIGLRVKELQSHFQEKCRRAVLTTYSSIKSGLYVLNECDNPPLIEYIEPSNGESIGNNLEGFCIHMKSSWVTL